MGVAGHSSGDLLADRRFEYARAYAEAGEHAAAADLCAQALEIVPDWLPALIAAADALVADGRPDEAFRGHQYLRTFVFAAKPAITPE